MLLIDYIREENLTVAEFSRRIGILGSTMHKYVHAERFPRPDVLKKIEEFTGGKVTYRDFLDQKPNGEAA